LPPNYWKLIICFLVGPGLKTISIVLLLAAAAANDYLLFSSLCTKRSVKIYVRQIDSFPFKFRPSMQQLEKQLFYAAASSELFSHSQG
jgi:hypothetical protein